MRPPIRGARRLRARSESLAPQGRSRYLPRPLRRRQMSVREHVLARINAALAACEADGLWSAELRTPVVLERPKQDGHGDLATNVAMTLAKAAKKNPRELAAAIVKHLAALPGDDVLD